MGRRASPVITGFRRAITVATVTAGMPQRIRVELAAPLKSAAERSRRASPHVSTASYAAASASSRKSLRHEVAPWRSDSVRTAIAQDVSWEARETHRCSTMDAICVARSGWSR